MAKYAKYQRQPIEKPRDVHPIWRGIGCLLFIITPPMAYALGRVLLNLALSRRLLPPEILNRITFDAWVLEIPVLGSIGRYIESINYPYAQLIAFVVALVALSAVVSTVYGIAYSTINPPQRSPVDAPPPRRRSREYKR